jgi:hypothetical protein
VYHGGDELYELKGLLSDVAVDRVRRIAAAGAR